MKNGIVIAGFAAIGKTYLGLKYDHILDLESSDFKWITKDLSNIGTEEKKGLKNRTLNPEWPSNYFSAIKQTIRKYDIVLTTISDELLEFLKTENLEFYIALPQSNSHEVIKKRCIKRGNNEEFINGVLEKIDYYRLLKEKFDMKQIIEVSNEHFLEQSLKKRGMLNTQINNNSML